MATFPHSTAHVKSKHGSVGARGVPLDAKRAHRTRSARPARTCRPKPTGRAEYSLSRPVRIPISTTEGAERLPLDIQYYADNSCPECSLPHTLCEGHLG
jgi:hypothetical protein